MLHANNTLRKRLNLLGQKRAGGGGVGEEKGMRGRGWRAPPYLVYPLKTMQFSLSGSKCTVLLKQGREKMLLKGLLFFSSFIAI